MSKNSQKRRQKQEEKQRRQAIRIIGGITAVLLVLGIIAGIIMMQG